MSELQDKLRIAEYKLRIMMKKEEESDVIISFIHSFISERLLLHSCLEVTTQCCVLEASPLCLLRPFLLSLLFCVYLHSEAPSDRSRDDMMWGEGRKNRLKERDAHTHTHVHTHTHTHTRTHTHVHTHTHTHTHTHKANDIKRRRVPQIRDLSTEHPSRTLS